MNNRSRGKGRLLQFKLKTLLLAVSLSAVAMAVWRVAGPIGVVFVAAIVLPPLGIAWIGAKPGQPILLGAAGGGLTAAALVLFVLCMLDADEDPLYLGLHLGLTLGGVALGSFFGALRHVWLTRKDRWPEPHEVRFSLRRHGWRLGSVLSICVVATFFVGRWVERRRWTDPSASCVITSGYGWFHTCELAGYGVDDAELPRVIAGLPQQYWHIRLVFYHTQVTDAGVALLHDVPNLYSVDLRGTHAGEQAVAALREAQPDCEIRW